MKNISLLILIFSTLFLASCWKQENIENTENTNSGKNIVQTWTENKELTNTGTIKEKEYKIVDLTNKSKAKLKCDEYQENCDLSITFWDLWTFNVYSGYIDLDKSFFDNSFWWKAYFNEKYNTIFVSFWTLRAWQIVLTKTVKIDLNSKKITKIEESYGSDFYFKNIDTIIPKYKSISETSYEELEEEWKAIILWWDSKTKENNLSGINFIKKYYEIMWKKDFNELANITDWNTFEQLQEFYKDLEKIELIDIKDLGNNKYKLTIDLYEKVLNNNWSAFSEKSNTQYLEDTFLYSRINIEKEIINWKLKTVKWNNKTIILPRVKSNYSWVDEKIDITEWWPTWIDFFEKKLSNWKIFKITWSPNDPDMLSFKLYNWKDFISWDINKNDFYWLMWIKTSDGYFWEEQDKKFITNFQQSTNDMIEKTLFQ